MDFKRSRWPWDVHAPKVKHQGYLLKSGRYFGERMAKKRHVALVVDLGGAYLLIGGEGEEEIGSLAHLQDAVDVRKHGRRKCIDLLVGCTIEERGDDRLGRVGTGCRLVAPGCHSIAYVTWTILAVINRTVF
jgi:hypothetical protein